MIYCIIGKRTPAFEKAYAGVLSNLGKNADIERKEATTETLQNIFDEYQTQSLFGEKKVFVVSGIFSDDDVKKEFLSSIKELADTKKDMVIIADSVLAADLKKLEPHAEVTKVLDKEKKEEKINPFTLTSVFATGDRKKTWIAFHELLQVDDEMEKLHGMMWWKIKDLAMKRGVFDKDAVMGMARKLVSVYHDARLGGRGIAERLEEFFLTMPSKK